MNNKKLPLIYLILMIIAVGFLSFATVSGARAAELQKSSEYTSEVALKEIGVSLIETLDDKDTEYKSGDDTSSSHIMSISNFIPGKTYPYEYSVENSGTIDAYIRVVVYKYWTKNNQKDPNMDPALIILNSAENSDWVIDTTSSTNERTVYYHLEPLAPEEKSAPFISSVNVNGSVAKVYRENPPVDGKITYTFDFNDATFVIEIEADAVQTHNPKYAIVSAWGARNVSVETEGGPLKVN